MWRYASRVRGIHFLWHGPHLGNALSSWLQKDEHTVYLALTVIIIWYVWYVRNLAIFEESYVPLEVFPNKALATLDLFPQVNEKNKLRIIKYPMINQNVGLSLMVLHEITHLQAGLGALFTLVTISSISLLRGSVLLLTIG